MPRRNRRNQRTRITPAIQKCIDQKIKVTSRETSNPAQAFAIALSKCRKNKR